MNYKDVARQGIKCFTTNEKMLVKYVELKHLDSDTISGLKSITTLSVDKDKKDGSLKIGDVYYSVYPSCVDEDGITDRGEKLSGVIETDEGYVGLVLQTNSPVITSMVQLQVYLIICLLMVATVGVGVWFASEKLPTMVARGTNSRNGSTGDTGKSVGGVVWDGEINNSNAEVPEVEYMDIPGYYNLYVTPENPVVELCNPYGNSVDLEYIIFNKDNDMLKIYESECLVAPGCMEEWNVYDNLSSGEYNLVFRIQPYNCKTGIRANVPDMEVKITVE